MENKDKIEIPFGAKDSELYECEYTIPEGYEAEIKDGKVIIIKKESEDEKVRKDMIETIKNEAHEFPSSVIAEKSNSWLSWLKKQGDKDKLIKELGEYKVKYTQEVLSQQLEKKGEQKQELLTKEKALKNSPFVEQKPNCCDEQKPADVRTTGYWHVEDVEQKPTWSKEDREMRMKVLRYLSTRCNVFEYEEVENWLKSLIDRVQPQQEWSKEESDMTDKITLREFINELEKLSDGGKNDNLEVGIQNSDEEVCPIGWCGVDEYYPIEEIEENNPQHPTKCIMIQY